MRTRIDYTSDSTDLDKRSTVEQLVKLYDETVSVIETTFARLDTTEKLMGLSVGRDGYFSFRSRHQPLSFSSSDAKETVTQFRVDMWTLIIDRLEVRNFLSIKRRKALDDQLRTSPETLPEITVESVLEFAEGIFGNLQEIHREAVQEVFEILRPRDSKHKTNTEYELGNKVVLEYWLDLGWMRFSKTYKCSHYRSPDATALENVFRTLDGKGQHHKGFVSELEQLINSIPMGSKGTYSTEYFKVKAYKNGNIHLEFRRLDLVKRLNQIAGGKRLPKGGTDVRQG